MSCLQKAVFFFILILLINPTVPEQSYDTSVCSSESEFPGSNYLCTAETYPCQTFVVYRAQMGFQSISSISSLFNLTMFDLLEINKVAEAESTNLTLSREIVIPVSCSCPDRSSEAYIEYNFSSSVSFDAVACGVFEGLAKAQTVKDQNPQVGDGNPDYLMIKVPIRCACPSANQSADGVNFLVTYPVIENDHTDLIASKFKVAEEMIWKANKLPPNPTIFPGTTLLVPVRDNPVVNWKIGSSSPAPRAVIPVSSVMKKTSSRSMNSLLLIGVGLLAAASLLTAVAYLSLTFTLWKKYHIHSFRPLSARSAASSNLTPDFLDGMLKLKQSLTSYSLGELIIATDDFSEASKIGTTAFRGEFGDSCIVIKKLASKEEARRVLYILTKINHVNIVKLEGCCFDPAPYLVFEFAEQGSLRDCLSKDKVARQFTWERRIQIAFDLAVALHYIHYCTKPSFAHRNVKSRNVLVTKDWRAKISGFRLAEPVIRNEDVKQNGFSVEDRKQDLAPQDGGDSFEADVFAFGIVLLELLLGKEIGSDEKLLKDCTNFMGNTKLEGSSGCSEKLETFIDPALEGKYPLGEALCLFTLAWACVGQIPHHRPTMDDVLKAVSSML